MTFFGPDLRNGLPIGLGSVAGFGIAPQFSPASLFLGGTVNGAWFDPSDATTLFSDRAGTTPCGTPGGGSVVPVGLMLDKSQGLVLGSELVSGTWANGTAFPFDTFTASGTGFTGNKTAFGISQAVLPAGVSIASGAFYRVEVRVTFADDEDITVSFQNASGGGGVASSSSFSFGNISAATTIVGYVRGTSTGTAYLQMSQQGTNRTLTVASVSVKLIAGNHAIAANDTTARPELRARVNLLLYSEQLNNTTVQRNYGTVTANAGISPSGANNAFLFAGTGGTAGWDSYPTDYGLNGGVTQTFSVYAKAGTTGNIRISIGGLYVDFNVSTGQKVAEFGIPGTITPSGNNWYRLTATTVKTNVFHYWQIYLDNAGATSNNAFLWGTQLINTNEFPANTYQRIADANTYDAVGFPRYLACNGTSSAMSTPGNVNLSGTDKVTVFAGVRKLSDAAVTIAELSADVNFNNGAFGVFNGFPGASDFQYANRGTAQSQVSSSVGAPATRVLTGIGDIPADSTILRLNGIQVGSSSGDLGTGNFGTYRLFIGARNNASLFLNGNIYGITVVGSALSAGQITQMEQWLAGKTGISI